MFNFKYIKDNAQPGSWRRGYDYHKKSQVLEMKLSRNVITGKVKGNFQDFYTTKLTIDKEFNVKIGPYVDSKCVELVAESFEFSKELSSNSVLLPTEFKYGVTAKWTSKDNAIDVTTGEIYEVSADTIARLEVVFSKGDATVSKTLTVIIHPYKGIVATEHNIKDYLGKFDINYTSFKKFINNFRLTNEEIKMFCWK